MNDDLLRKISKVLTVLLSAYFLYITPYQKRFGDLNFLDGIVAGTLLSFVLYLPVLFIVDIFGGIVEVIREMFKGTQ